MHKTTMKHLYLFLFLSTILFCCKKEQVNEGIPSYISIPFLGLSTEELDEGSSSHLITDAWVYFNNDLQGIYPIPCTFPVLLQGKQNISIKAGIKNNGISATRVKYPFYDYFKDTINLIQDSIIIIDTSVKYVENTNFLIEDFENSGTIFEPTSNSDTSYFLISDTSMEENSLGAYLSLTQHTFEIATGEIDTLPRTGVPVYIELNYNCNTAFSVGVFANYPQTVTTMIPITINPKEDWNKIYIDLTSTIASTQNANSHKIFISMTRDVISTEIAELYIDNFKLVY